MNSIQRLDESLRSFFGRGPREKTPFNVISRLRKKYGACFVDLDMDGSRHGLESKPGSKWADGFTVSKDDADLVTALKGGLLEFFDGFQFIDAFVPVSLLRWTNAPFLRINNVQTGALKEIAEVWFPEEEDEPKAELYISKCVLKSLVELNALAFPLKSIDIHESQLELLGCGDVECEKMHLAKVAGLKSLKGCPMVKVLSIENCPDLADVTGAIGKAEAIRLASCPNITNEQILELYKNGVKGVR